jgi:8-oxo-dGTP diphosphatase
MEIAQRNSSKVSEEDKQIGGGVVIEVTAAIIKKNNKYLICQRANNDECQLLWEFPGGKLEDCETLEQCMIREIKEELNLAIKVIDVFATTVYQFKDKEIHFTFFRCDILNGEIEKNVHNAIKWVTAGEMKKYSFMPADVEIVDKLVMAT